MLTLKVKDGDVVTIGPVLITVRVKVYNGLKEIYLSFNAPKEMKIDRLKMTEEIRDFGENK